MDPILESKSIFSSKINERKKERINTIICISYLRLERSVRKEQTYLIEMIKSLKFEEEVLCERSITFGMMVFEAFQASVTFKK